LDPLKELRSSDTLTIARKPPETTNSINDSVKDISIIETTLRMSEGSEMPEGAGLD
jgi:hypothetical protein